MVSQGSFMPVFTRPVALILFLIIVWTVLSQFQVFRDIKDNMICKIFPRKLAKTEQRLKSSTEQSEES
jgi:putative tricarboxylic transport membrane protein